MQDHPYVPDFLDTFALIGHMDRIRFMTHVANPPLRPPQMLAKASASLDLLSGGRFELVPVQEHFLLVPHRPAHTAA